jgi:uncharacterized protein YggE
MTYGVDVDDDQLLVRGEGEARSLPDTAIIRVTVSGEGTSRESAYDKAAADAKAVDEVIDHRRGSLERVGDARLVVQPKSRWKKGESVRTGWVARRMTVVEVGELVVIGELLAELAGAGADVAGPAWQLDPENPAFSAARRAAAEDARRRADDYAAALRVTAAEVAWVAEPGLRLAGEAGHPGMLSRADLAMPTGASPTEELIDVSPAEMTVTAHVEVAFRLERQG